LDLITEGRETSIAEADLESIVLYAHHDAIRAKTPTQKEYYQAVKKNDIVFAIGPAGTGKTYLAVAMAVSALKNREVNKIVLARPAVEAGESLGFLPGDLSQKVDPYLRPLYDALQEMLTAEKLKTFVERGTVEVVPLAYMRGRTLNNAFVILDEAQNATAMQMKMFLTRLGAGSKAIVTGDETQIDLPRNTMSGLVQIQEVLQDVEGIKFVYFNKGDVVRHKLVKDIIEAYERYQDTGHPSTERPR
jgi:phosphate starvation-inducible PhoH-like protein